VKISLFVGFLIFLSTAEPLHCALFTYDISSGEKKDHVEWTKTTNADRTIEFTSLNHFENVSHRMVCDENLQTITWSYVNQKSRTNYQITRQKNKLVFQGELNGECIEKTIDVPDLPWFQIHGISFPEFLKSGASTLDFLSVKPESGKIVELQATRQNIEEILVKEQIVKAVRIDVRLKGMLSHLGKASYWFRIRDFVFVRYEGTSASGGFNSVVYELDESTNKEH
jgi:hypothetical protein